MTVHQLYYTSCEDGLEGIQGFQISALTPGAPKPLVELAVRASAYEVGPYLGARLAEGDPSSFPIAFGYVPSGRSAALFQSRYLGADFTGRMGNYFAHALLLDDAERELHGVLPIDLWRSPAWVHTRQNGTTLPALSQLPSGTAAELASTRRLLSGPDMPAHLAELISAAQSVLSAGRGRVVLVAADDQMAALWLATLCRSFPRRLGMRISFVTYTSRPAESGVLVSCTLPDVHLPSYGDFTTVDTTDGPTAAEHNTRYGSAMARLWAAGAAGAAIELAGRAEPPLAVTDLEAFAVLLDFSADHKDVDPLEATLLLDAIELALDRLPGLLPADSWQRIADHVQDHGGPTDLSRWSVVLRRAANLKAPLPTTLLGAYYIAALNSADRIWLPTLSAADIRDVAEHTVLPALISGQPTPLLRRLDQHRDLADAVTVVLERRLADQAELRRLAAVLTPDAARLLLSVPGIGGGCRLLAELVLARHGKADPVALLDRLCRSDQIEWWHLGPVLWPGGLTVVQASQVLRGLPAEVVRETQLAEQIIEDLLRRTQHDEVDPVDARLIDDILRSELVADLDPDQVTALATARMVVHFESDTPQENSVREVREGLALLPSLPRATAERLRHGIVTFTLRASPAAHRDLLSAALEDGGGPFLATYQEMARAQLRKAAPGDVAAVVLIWRTLPRGKVRSQLIEVTLPAALSRRRRRFLDRVGDHLPSAANKLDVRAAAPKGGWRDWWQTWRTEHERRGLLGWMMGRRS
ncbi:MAG TPA: hypothetical protein VGL06_07065 [Pseudonocardiaceae bacterium]